MSVKLRIRDVVNILAEAGIYTSQYSIDHDSYFITLTFKSVDDLCKAAAALSKAYPRHGIGVTPARNEVTITRIPEK